MKTIIGSIAATMLLAVSVSSSAQDFLAPPDHLNFECSKEIVKGNYHSSCDEAVRRNLHESAWHMIHLASWYGNTDAVKKIIATRPDAKDQSVFWELHPTLERWSDIRPLHMAEMNFHWDTASVLRGHNQPSPASLPPTTPHHSCVRLIYGLSKDINEYISLRCGSDDGLSTDHEGWSLIAIASGTGHSDFFLRGLSGDLPDDAFRPVNRKGTVGDGYSPMAVAYTHTRWDFVDLLYALGHPKPMGYTPSKSANAILYNAIKEGKLKTLNGPYGETIHGSNDPKTLLLQDRTPSAIINYADKGNSVLHLLMDADKRDEEHAELRKLLLEKDEFECGHSGATQCGTDDLHVGGNPIVSWIANTPLVAVADDVMQACQDVFPFGNVGTADDDSTCIGTRTRFESHLYGGGLHIALVEWDMSNDGFSDVAIECISEGGNEIGGAKRDCGWFHAMGWPSQPYSDAVKEAGVYCSYSSPTWLRAGEEDTVGLEAMLGEGDGVIGCTVMSSAPFSITIR